MIKIRELDTIIDVVNKINECKDDEIILNFPFGHPILHNYLSLKILKNKAWNKRITILTNDIASKKIWKSLWINYSILKDADFFKEKTLKQEFLKHNFTFFEYFIFEIKKYTKRFIKYLQNKTWVKPLKYYSPEERVRKSWIMFLAIWLLMSIWMLLFIFYFAVSKTYVEIIPKIDIRTTGINIIYEEGSTRNISVLSNELVVPIKKVWEKISLTQTYKTTWIDYENTKRSKWKVVFINELRESQTFRPNTRLLSKDWIIFETTDWINIPWRTLNGSWEVVFWKSNEIEIIARVYDEKWSFIWSRWNLDWEQLFTIPWLNFNQDRIYAKLVWETTWWEDNISYKVDENDIKNAKEILEERLKKEVFDKLKTNIIEENRINTVSYEILWINNIIEYKNIDIKTIWDIKIWDKIDNFDLIWEIEIQAYTYNKNNVLNIMRNVISKTILQWTEKLMFIDENSLRMVEVLERKNSPLYIKATTQINAWIAFDFDNNLNNYNQRLKLSISGLDKNEAENILLNDEKVSNVKITNTPFFINKVTWSIDNIVMSIKR